MTNYQSLLVKILYIFERCLSGCCRADL